LSGKPFASWPEKSLDRLACGNTRLAKELQLGFLGTHKDCNSKDICGPQDGYSLLIQ
jgi:hypothetical protein